MDAMQRNADKVRVMTSERLSRIIIKGDYIRNDPWYRNKYLTVVADDPIFFPHGVDEELRRRNKEDRNEK